MVEQMVYYECPKCDEKLKKRMGDAMAKEGFNLCPKCDVPMDVVKSEVAKERTGVFAKLFG